VIANCDQQTGLDISEQNKYIQQLRLGLAHIVDRLLGHLRGTILLKKFWAELSVALIASKWM
jgi:hypothetical protein